MRGSVRKRGSTWSVIVDVGLDANGKRKQQWRGGFTSRKDAEAELTRVLRRLQTGEYVAPSKLTVGAFLNDEWLPAIRATVRPTTYRSYETHVRVHIEPLLGQVPLQKLTGARLNEFYAALARSRQRGMKPLSPATVRRAHAMLHRALRDAVRWDRIARNPADLSDPPKQRATAAREMSTWSSDDVVAFLSSVHDDRLYALWLFLITTGLRRGEAAGLRWQDVDLERRRASIRQAHVAVGYAVEVAEPKTSRSRRVLALDKGTVAVLRAHRKSQLVDRLAAGTAWRETGLVFVQSDGVALHPDRITKLFDKAVLAAGVPRIRLHDLRHTHATLALEAGLHPKVVSDRLGHSTTSVTLDIYSHVTPSLQEEAAETVAALLQRPRTTDEAGLPSTS
jgi:integrase